MRKEQEILVRRLNQLCKEKGYSYYTLSNISDVPLSTLMHLLDGTVKNPSFYTVVKLCGAFQIGLGELFSPKEFAALLEALEEEG